ncbi:MAG: hypothetical protein ACK52L_23935 [Pirellula sp.]
MEDWIFDSKRLMVGLVHLDPRRVSSKQSKLCAYFGTWNRNGIKPRKPKVFRSEFDHVLLFHRPFTDKSFEYDVCNKLVLSGVSLDDYSVFKSVMMKMEFVLRDLWIRWALSERVGESYKCGFDKYRKREELNVAQEGEWFGISNFFSCLSPSNPQGEDRELLRDFNLVCEKIDDPRAQELYHSTGSVDGLSLASGLEVLDLMIEHLGPRYGSPSQIKLSFSPFDLYDPDPHELFARGTRLGADIWHIWENNWTAPKGFDRFALPVDASEIRAYPMINVKSTHRLFGLDYAINVVHVRGESFVEVQAYDAPELMQMTADVLGAPVDVWDGPLEDRFGWYGDASKGTTHRLEPAVIKTEPTKHETQTKATPVETVEKAFVISPKVRKLSPDGKSREVHSVYRRPVAVESSMPKLRVVAVIKDIDLDGDMYPARSLREHFGHDNAEETFDWSSYSRETQNKACQLAQISSPSIFVAEMNRLWDKLDVKVQSELVLLLQLSNYRITEVSLSSSDRKKLSKAIGSAKVTPKTDEWIATLLNQTCE